MLLFLDCADCLILNFKGIVHFQIKNKIKNPRNLLIQLSSNMFMAFFLQLKRNYVF